MPPEVPHDMKICIEDLVDMEIDQLKDDEKKGKQPGNGTQELMKKRAREWDPRTRGDEREVLCESVDKRPAALAHRNEDDRRSCQRRRSMLRLSQAQPRQSEKREHWNMLTSGSGRRRRRIGPTTPPTLKPTRSHRARVVKRMIRVPRTRQVDTQRQDQ